MKQKSKILAVMAICIMGMVGLYQVHNAKEKQPLSDLALENINALASGENGNVYCIGRGDIECLGNRVEFRYDGFSLD
ncbi:hypothetical protein B5F77_14365 [Parabacteroides sp. An277]|uniref:NVEALA domain-containing protein n=1 Tax=Parabacteroides sp. An277 TaxID=1965619 RepID=UPI000B3912E2|nr:NVEALA domain-containing protein [Parabacteroides sp. An277]OUO49664.1 hypothetical protein B5F77_14365 [Parabacteroides sp. An277]